MPTKTKKRQTKKTDKISALAESANLPPWLNKEIPPTKVAKYFAWISVAVLGLTSVFWAVLSAKIQQANADELVNSYLFENFKTFRHADLPGAHSFLIKWPLFYLAKIFGNGNSIVFLTVVSTLIAIGALVYILRRIERRPLVFGTLCLALASVLLMVPAQSYPGALLPVNMAMLATRNIEYAVYIFSILFLLKSSGQRNKWFWLSVGMLALLIASDKLFMALSLVGAVLGLIIFAVKRSMDAIYLTSNWLTSAIIASVGAIILVELINLAHLTHIVAGSGSLPYTIVGGAKDFVLASLYAVLGIFTNLGANPAYDATIVRGIPHHALSALFGWGGIAYLINILVVGFCVYGVYHLFKTSLKHKESDRLVFDRYFSLGLLLVLSSFSAVLLFVGTNHYYAVDARYLTIVLFTFFICAAILTRHHRWSNRQIGTATSLLGVAIFFGVANSVQIYAQQSDASQDVRDRNKTIAQALKSNRISTLVGDYWRVIPIRDVSHNNLQVAPLANCTNYRDVLSSTNWQPNLKNASFAYLLSLDDSQTDYPHCSTNDVLAKYGQPDSSILIAGSLSQPKELLLTYSHGIREPVKSSANASLNGTIIPIELADLEGTECEGPSVTNIVAHEDDDLLFMSPDLLHDIQAGHCVRTVYMTSGDSGSDKFYWLAREAGSEAAYSKMLNTNEIWAQKIVKVGPKQFITIANPKGNDSVSLIFVHLPDGGLKGNGFGSTGHETLEKLRNSTIHQIHSTDLQSVYKPSDLIHMLSSIMYLYQPTEIRTQSSYQSSTSQDHGDHMAVGNLVKRAYASFNKQALSDQTGIPLKFYMGYPIKDLPGNVSGADFEQKRSAFLDYASFDGAVCRSVEQCSPNSTYGLFLARQYQNSY